MLRLLMAAVLVSIALSNGPAPAFGKTENQQPQSHPRGGEQPTPADERGTEQSPLVVKTIPAPKTEAEAAEEKAERDDISAANWWMVRLTGLLGLIGTIQAVVFWIQARRLRQTIKKMDEIASGQTADMRDSIAAAARSAVAMEGVAQSMAINVEAVKQSVATTREIADRQKLVTELQSRAYISVAFYGMVPQDTAAGTRFEPRMQMINNGNTPAYDVTFRAAADVLPQPVPNDFTFPLPDVLPSRSVSVIGPRLTKIIPAVVPKIYPDVEVEQLKKGAGQRIHMWGVVNYKDAFGIDRFVKFSHSFFWLSDGKSVMSSDTARHNDAN